MEPVVFKKSYSYTKADGKPGRQDLDLVDIPPGTLLFRGVRLPDISKGDDQRYFYRDFLGDVKGDSFCLTPTHNVFFYPFPHIPFGADGVGDKFNAIQIYVTRKTLRLVCMISPTDSFRGFPKPFDGDAPIQRCDKFHYDCKELTAEEEGKKKWDNCLHPKFAQQEQVNGWIGIADLDSLDVLDKRELATKNSTLSKYLLERNGRNPGKIAQMLTWMYTDVRRHRAIPEIALHPWAKHPGEEIIFTDAANEDEAIEAIMANADKFAYLPLACITASGILDGVNSDFLASNIGDNSSTPASQNVRGSIEKQTDLFLDDLSTKGIELPGLGLSKLTFDTRTGFYVLDKFAQKAALKGTDIPYSKLLLPLETPEQQEFAILYSIHYRSFVPDKFMAMETIAPQQAPVYRAFIFERPPALDKMFTNLEKPIPKMFETPAQLALEEAKQLGRLAPRTRKGGPQRSQRGGSFNKTRKALRKMMDTASDTVETLSKQSEKFLSKQVASLHRAFVSRSL
jgi:hypothetical protein